MLALAKPAASALIARKFSNRVCSCSSRAPFCTRRSRIVARCSNSPASALASHGFGGNSCQAPNLSASLKVFVECASRKRAAPRSQFNGVAAGGDARSGRNRRPHLHTQGLWRWKQPRCLAPFRVACGSETIAPRFAVKQRPNPSVELRANGRPLQGKRVLSLRGRPLSPAHLKR